jgi:outer membrane immunogenic protein
MGILKGGRFMKPLRSYLLATASSAALIGSAAAADLPVKAQPAPTVWSWAGPYIGLNLGVAWNHAEFSDNIGSNSIRLAFADADSQPFWSPTVAGFTAGGQAGYNWQTGNIVYGIEGDMNWVDAKATALFSAGSGVTANTKLDWIGTVRGRVGVTFSRALLYGTGGLAVAHFYDAWGFTGIGGNDFVNDIVRAGWTAGGGVEYMVTRNWTARAEVLYADFGSNTLTAVNPPGGGGGTYTSTFRHTTTTARAALNWKW